MDDFDHGCVYSVRLKRVNGLWSISANDAKMTLVSMVYVCRHARRYVILTNFGLKQWLENFPNSLQTHPTIQEDGPSQ